MAVTETQISELERLIENRARLNQMPESLAEEVVTWATSNRINLPENQHPIINGIFRFFPQDLTAQAVAAYHLAVSAGMKLTTR